MKQVRLVGGTVPPFVAVLVVGERGQPTGEVGPIVVIAEVTHSAPSSILAKRKQDDGVGPSGRKKSKAPMSLHALRQSVGLMPGAGYASSSTDRRGFCC